MRELSQHPTSVRRRTRDGVIRRKYELMRARTTGIQWRGKDKDKHANYIGMKLLSREEYYNWVEETKDQFEKIYVKWKDSGYQYNLVPTIDRIDPKKGYTIDNMQWLSFSDNMKRIDK